MTELIAYLPTPFPDLPFAGNANNGASGYAYAPQFDLTAPICVTAVGAFDSDQNGFVGDITVALWLKDAEAITGTLIEDSTTTFTSSDAGDLDGIFRWKSLEVPFELTVGTYFISTEGFDDVDTFSSGYGVFVQPGDDVLDFPGAYNFAYFESPVESPPPNLPSTNSYGGANFLWGNFKFFIGDCTAQPVTPVKKPPVKKNPNRQGGKKGKRAGKKGKKV
jgi:hypothetical protein